MKLLKENTSFRNLLLFSITLLSINQFFMLALINLSENIDNPSIVLGKSMTLLTVSKIFTLPISGYLVDYIDEKKMLIISSIGFIIFFLIVLVQNSIFDDVSNYIFFYATCSGILLGFVQPSTYSIIPRIVSTHQRSEANSLFQTSSQLSQFITPTVAAIFIGSLSKNYYYTLIIVLSLICLHFSCKIEAKNFLVSRNPKMGNRASLNDYKLILRNSSIIGLLLLTAIINFSTSGPLQVSLPIFVNHELNQSTSNYGYLMSIYGLGSFIGSLGSIFFKKKNENLSLLLFLSVSFGLFWMATLQSDNAFIIICILFISGIFMGMINVLFMSVLQNVTPKRLFGRVTSIQLFSSSILTPLSFSLIGKLSSEYSASTIFYFSGLLISISGLFIYLLTKKGKKYFG